MIFQFHKSRAHLCLLITWIWNIDIYNIFNTSRSGTHNDNSLSQNDCLIYIMRDKETCFSFTFPCFQKFCLQLGSCLGIQSSEWLIHKKNFRFYSIGSCNCNTLFHTTGEFLWIMIYEIFKLYHLDIFHCNFFRFSIALALQFQSKHNIFQNRQPWEQCILLEYNTSFSTCSFNFLAINIYRSTGWSIQPCDNIQQCRFTAPGRSYHTDEFIFFNIKIYSV